eukprot:2271053-Rhodomonas_salina.1
MHVPRGSYLPGAPSDIGVALYGFEVKVECRACASWIAVLFKWDAGGWCQELNRSVAALASQMKL